MMSGIVTALVSPLGTALSLWSLCLLLWLAAGRGRARPVWRRAGFAAGALGWAWLLLWSLPVASEALRASLEDRAGARALADLPARPVAVVLGGGVSGARPPQRPDPDLGSAADRLWHAARLYRAGLAAHLLLCGGHVRTGDGSEAQAMRRVLLDLGVPDEAIWVEEGSVNTSGNAAEASRQLRERGIGGVLLVTSALHMPRARAAFERAGLDVVPAPTDFEVIPVPPGVHRILPDVEALAGSARAMKEIVGRWTGR